MSELSPLEAPCTKCGHWVETPTENYAMTDNGIYHLDCYTEGEV